MIADNCDSLGTKWRGKYLTDNAVASSCSFYPAHHITMGEGGAVVTKNGVINKVLESIRDWSRDCWCAPGDADTCNRRYDWELGNLPYGYDHKYIYSHIGYNLKLTDLQASVAVSYTHLTLPTKRIV